MPITATDIETWLTPVSAQAPCGSDMFYEPEFVALRELARGKPEQAIGDTVRPAQDPPWDEVRAGAERLLRSTKDLRVTGILYCALLKTDGIAGLSASLALMRGLLEKHWDNVYPLLDAEDDNDPTLRVNSLIAALAGEEAMSILRQLPLVESRKFGKHSLRACRVATGAVKGDPAQQAQELARMEGAFQEMDIEALKAAGQAASQATEHLNAIEKLLMEHTGGIPDALGPPRADVKEISSIFAGQLTKRGAGTSPDAAAQPQGGTEGGSAMQAPAVRGEIRSRADVISTLDALCEYYARFEPSSPVPLLLQRAKRLVDKGFMDIMRDLAPGGVPEAELIGGLEKKES